MLQLVNIPKRTKNSIKNKLSGTSVFTETSFIFFTYHSVYNIKYLNLWFYTVFLSNTQHSFNYLLCDFYIALYTKSKTIQRKILYFIDIVKKYILIPINFQYIFNKI